MASLSTATDSNTNALYDTGFDLFGDKIEETGWWKNHRDFLGYTYAQAQETLEIDATA